MALRQRSASSLANPKKLQRLQGTQKVNNAVKPTSRDVDSSTPNLLSNISSKLIN